MADAEGLGLVIVGGGSGTRLAAAQPKAFVELGGTPLLEHCVRRLGFAVDHLVVVVPHSHVQQARALVEAAGAVAEVVAGGATRSRSVAAGLAALPPTSLVAVHDAARPLADAAILRQAVGAIADGADGVAPALPLTDTVKQVVASPPRTAGTSPGAETVLETVDRSTLRAVQTPQVFRREVLRRAHEAHPDGATDDLTLVEMIGGVVRLIPGHPSLQKVTHGHDLVVLQALMEALALGSAR